MITQGNTSFKLLQPSVSIAGLDSFLGNLYSSCKPTDRGRKQNRSATCHFLETYVTYPPDVVANPIIDPNSP